MWPVLFLDVSELGSNFDLASIPCLTTRGFFGDPCVGIISNGSSG